MGLWARNSMTRVYLAAVALWSVLSCDPGAAGLSPGSVRKAVMSPEGSS